MKRVAAEMEYAAKNQNILRPMKDFGFLLFIAITIAIVALIGFFGGWIGSAIVLLVAGFLTSCTEGKLWNHVKTAAFLSFSAYLGIFLDTRNDDWRLMIGFSFASAVSYTVGWFICWGPFLPAPAPGTPKQT